MGSDRKAATGLPQVIPCYRPRRMRLMVALWCLLALGSGLTATGLVLCSTRTAFDDARGVASIQSVNAGNRDCRWQAVHTLSDAR